MATMDFYRRPLLAGLNITRMSLASIRGSVRRHDADGTVAFPYFTGAAAAQTLTIKVDGVTFNVTISGVGISTILTDINAVLLTAGTAFDADGTIGIKTSTSGGTGSVEVTGGTASVFLGFDTSNGRIRAANGDIPSSPEGRIGNWMGVAFPNKGENFTTESVTRGLSRIAGNSDVLYSDISRNDAVVKQVAYTTSDRRLLTISPPTQALFISKLFLSSTSDKETLAPYFHLIDQATKQIAKSRVVGVVRGAVIGLPIYPNAGTWTGGASVGNVLGQSLVKVPLVTIDSIRNGRIIEASTADFTDVIVGDLVQIAGATNTSQWSNNGLKWIVEEKISNTILAVRPMSKSELTTYVVTVNEEQPVLELNTAKTGLEVYGSVAILAGQFCSHVNVIVDPPIPVGATYDLWAAVPGSLRSATGQAIRESLSPVYRDAVSDFAPTENGTLSGLTASQSGPNCLTTTGLLRLHGKVYSIPARTFLPGEFADGTNYLYWEETTGNYAISLLTTPWASVLNPAVTTNKGHIVALVTVAGGVITGVVPMAKLRGENAVPITIGVGGQFPSIEAASVWVQGLVANYTETASASGSFPHFEFIVVSDLTLSTLVPFGTIPSVTLRGATDSVKLTLGGSYFQIQGKRFEIKDLTISSAVDSNYLVRVIGAASTDRVVVKNVKQTAGNLWSVIETTGSGVLNEAQVLDCDLRVSRSVVRGTGSGARGVDSIRVLRSKFTHVASLAPHIICHGAGPATPWDGDLLVIQDCDFTGNWGSSAGADVDPMFVNESGAHPTVPSQIVIQNIRMSLGNYASVNGAMMIKAAAANCIIDNFYVTTGRIPIAVRGSTPTIVTNSKFRVNPEGTTVFSMQAGIIDHCTILHADTDANSTGGVGVAAGGKVSNCVIGPYFFHAITAGPGATEISGNVISTVIGGTAENLDACIWVDGANDLKILNNTINVGVQNSGTGLGYGVRFTNNNTCVIIQGNHFTLTTQDTSIGATSGTNTKILILNNTVISPDLVSEQAMDLSRITEGEVIGNSIQMTGGVGSVALRSGTLTTSVRIANNYLEADTAFTNAGTNPLIYEGNHFVGFVTNVFGVATGNVFTATTNGLGVTNIKGQISQNNFNFNAPATAHTVTNVSGRFEGNLVSTNVIAGGTGQEVSLEFIGNSVGGNFTCTNAFTSAHVSGNTFNVAGSGTVTINTTGVWGLHNNYASGAVSITVTELESSGNRFGSDVTLNVSNAAHISSSLFGGNTSVTANPGFISSSTLGGSLGSCTLSIVNGSVTGSRLQGTGGASIICGQVSGCTIGNGDFQLGTNSASFVPLIFTGNTLTNGILYVNAGVNQHAVVSGNFIDTAVNSPNGSALTAIDVQRGDGVIITGNTLHGPAFAVLIGTAATVHNCTVSNNYIKFQRGDWGQTASVLTAADNGGGGILGAGTYQYLIIWRGTRGGANDALYSSSALSNSVVLGAPSGINLTLTPFPNLFHAGLTLVALELWRTNNAGATWKKLTTTTFGVGGTATDIGEVGAVLTPIITTVVNETNNIPAIKCVDCKGVRILGNFLQKQTVTGLDVTFLIVSSTSGSVLIGDNNFTGTGNGVTDDANTGVGDDDTYWTANPTTTYAASGNVGSGGTRE